MPAHAFTPAERWLLQWIGMAENWIRRQPEDSGLWRADGELHVVVWIQRGIVLGCRHCGRASVEAPPRPGIAVECTVCGDVYLFRRLTGWPPGAPAS